MRAKNHFSLVIYTFVSLFFIYIALWLLIAHLIEDGFKNWANTLQAQGQEITISGQEIKGLWPELWLYNPIFKASDSEVQGLRAIVAWRELSKIHVFFEGDYSFFHKTRNGQSTLVARSEKAWLEVPLIANSFPLGINLKKAKLVDNNGFIWGVDSLRFGWDNRDINHLKTDLEAYGLNIPSEYEPLISPNIETIYLKASLSDAWPENQPFMQALRRWSNNGGAVELEEGEINWHPVKSRMNATLVFDKRMQPIFSAVISTSGMGELLDILSSKGIIKPRDAAISKLGLSLLSKPGREGDPFEQKISLTLQEGVLSLGPVKLLKVPDLKWYWEEEEK